MQKKQDFFFILPVKKVYYFQPYFRLDGTKTEGKNQNSWKEPQFLGFIC